MRALLVLLLAAATVPAAAARPQRPVLQVGFVGFQPATEDIDAWAVRTAEASVVRGLTKAGVPMLTPAQVRARIGEAAHKELLLCVSATHVCDVPPAVAPLHLIIGWLSRDGRRVESQLVVLRPDGTHTETVEISAGYLQLAMSRWEHEAEVLPATLASTLKLHYAPPAQLERGLLTSAGGAVLLGGGIFALVQFSQRDRQLRGLEPPTPTQEVASTLATEGATYRNVGVVLTGAGAVALGVGLVWITRGAFPAPVPAVLPMPGGAVAVFSGSLP